MTMTAREAFERGTETFNSQDIDGFAEVLADDVVFEAPGGLRGQGKAACLEFYGSWFGAFPDAHVDVRCLHIIGDVAIAELIFESGADGRTSS
jgi:ketosteroid isomerase-like protein